LVRCEICGKELSGLSSLARHIGKHNVTAKEYYDKYFKKPGEGICPITGKATRFISLVRGYAKYSGRGTSNKSEEMKRKARETCKRKYGVEYASQSDIIKQRKVQTYLERYGVENPSQITEVKQKKKQTWIQKYNVEHPSQSDLIKEKKRQTYLKRYGVESPLQSKEVKAKVKQTCLAKYGVSNPMQLREIQEKAKQTNLEKYGTYYATQSEEVKEKTKQTNLKKYGVLFPSQLKEIKEKTKQTNLKKYGTECSLQNEEVQKKAKQSMRKKYGVDHPMLSPVILQQREETVLKKYGVKNVFQLKEVREKAKRTCLATFGTEYATQSEVIQEKIKKTNLEKYGVEYHFQSDEVKEKIKQTNLKKYQSEEIKRKMHESLVKKFQTKLTTILENLGLKLLDNEYKNAHYIHHWRCLKCGYEFTQIWNVIQQGYLCPKCYPKTKSKGEDELVQFLETLGLDVQKHNRDLISPLELDVVLPNHKIAIEYDGLYWHNEELVGKDYHLRKTQLCEEKGYQLIHIFEDEWLLKKEIVKSRLKHILGKTEDCTHIGARKCFVREISTKEKNDFLEKFHIQGPDASKVKLGAFYQGQLVAVMTFSHGSLAKGVKKQDPLIWELNRFCTHLEFVISGIAGKLLEHFKKNYNWKEIFSYADRRWSNGNLYEKLGLREFIDLR